MMQRSLRATAAVVFLASTLITANPSHGSEFEPVGVWDVDGTNCSQNLMACRDNGVCGYWRKARPNTSFNNSTVGRMERLGPNLYQLNLYLPHHGKFVRKIRRFEFKKADQGTWRRESLGDEVLGSDGQTIRRYEPSEARTYKFCRPLKEGDPAFNKLPAEQIEIEDAFFMSSVNKEPRLTRNIASIANACSDDTVPSGNSIPDKCVNAIWDALDVTKDGRLSKQEVSAVIGITSRKTGELMSDADRGGAALEHRVRQIAYTEWAFKAAARFFSALPNSSDVPSSASIWIEKQPFSSAPYSRSTLDTVEKSVKSKLAKIKAAVETRSN